MSEKKSERFKALFYRGDLADYYPGHILGEVYKDRVYAPYLAGKSDLTILDVGGNIGWTAQYFAGYAKNVYVVEPAKEHCEVIQQLIDYNEYKNIHLIKAAVSNKPGTLTLNHNTNKTMFSLSEAVADKSLSTEEVEVKTLSQILAENNIEHVDLLKLDPEGEEANILCGEDFRSVADKFDCVIFEYHSWANRNIDQIRTTMKDLGFSWGQMPTEATVFVCERIE